MSGFNIMFVYVEVSGFNVYLGCNKSIFVNKTPSHIVTRILILAHWKSNQQIEILIFRRLIA